MMLSSSQQSKQNPLEERSSSSNGGDSSFEKSSSDDGSTSHHQYPLEQDISSGDEQTDKIDEFSQQQATSVSQLQPCNPLELIPELCRNFYHLGWVSGTGGGLSIRQNGRIYCAPSGVQKERIKSEDMFILNEDGHIIRSTKNPNLKVSECLSLFMVPFKLRNAGSCIHIHSIHANLVTAFYSRKNFNYQNAKNPNLYPASRQFKVFKISNQEMIKGIKKGASSECFQYNDTLEVPIIENVLHERDLAGAMFEAVRDFPLANAVLVRNHGCYIWGKSWDQAKSMAECYDYLFRLKVEAVKCGFDWMLEE